MEQHEIDARIIEVDAHAREAGGVADVVARDWDFDGLGQQRLRQPGKTLAFVGVGLCEHEYLPAIPIATLV